MGRRSKDRQPKKKVDAAVDVPEFPSADTADFGDPESHAVWAFCGIPHMKGAPMGFPIFLARKLSQRLWDCGFRYHPELRTIKYRPPHTNMGAAMFTSAGEWVGIDEPDADVDPAEETRAAIAGLPDASKRKIAHALGLEPADDTTEDDGMVPYLRADGSTTWVTPARARAWANAKRARKEGTA